MGAGTALTTGSGPSIRRRGVSAAHAWLHTRQPPSLAVSVFPHLSCCQVGTVCPVLSGCVAQGCLPRSGPRSARWSTRLLRYLCKAPCPGWFAGLTPPNPIPTKSQIASKFKKKKVVRRDENKESPAILRIEAIQAYYHPPPTVRFVGAHRVVSRMCAP